MVVATTAWASRLRAARSRCMAARTASDRALFVLDLRRGGFWLWWSLGKPSGFFLRSDACLLGGCFLGLAIFFGAAALLDARVLEGAVLAAARFLERGEAAFLGLAQEFRLHLLAG